MAILACYCIDITAQQYLFERFNSAADIEQAQQYAHPQRRQQFLAVRALLRWLVAQHISATLPLQILKHSSGAPYLMLSEQLLNCSISHSDDAVMVAVSTAGEALGVDIERFDATRWQNTPVIAKYQHGMMHEVGASSLARAQRWNLAEAVVKAEQGKLLEVLQRQPESLLAQASLGVVADYCYAIYHPDCGPSAIRVVPVAAID